MDYIGEIKVDFSSIVISDVKVSTKFKLPNFGELFFNYFLLKPLLYLRFSV
jgi:hypothetical protein